jgi:predicted dehydrogenase
MRETGLFELVAAYDLNPVALDTCCREDGCVAVTSYEALLNVPGIEAVIICTGAKFHAEQVAAAVERGLHVFVEKPLCSTVEEMKALLEVERRHGAVIVVGHQDHTRYPQTLVMKEKIDRGELGILTAVERTTCHSGGWSIKPGDWRGDPAKNPGGMLFQCGCHAFHELMFLFGPIKEIQAVMRGDVNGTTGTADAAICLMRFESGLLGTLNTYHVTPYRHTMNVFGSRANLYRTEHYFDRGTEIFLQVDNRDNQEQDLQPVPVEQGEGKSHSGSLINFYEAVRNGQPASPSLHDGARAVAAVFGAERSAQEKRPVLLSEILALLLPPTPEPRP